MDFPRNALLLLCLAAAGSGVNLLHGQSPSPEETTSHRFQAVIMGEPPRQIFYESEGEERPLMTSRNRRSRTVYTHQGGNRILFFTRETGTEGETVRVPFATARIRGGTRRFLVIFQRNPAAPEGPRLAFVLPEDDGLFAVGQARVLNLSPYPLACVVGDRRIAVPPGENRTVSVANPDNAVTYKIAARIDDEWEIVKNTSTRFFPTMRELLLVNVTGRQDDLRLEVHSLIDSAPANR